MFRRSVIKDYVQFLHRSDQGEDTGQGDGLHTVYIATLYPTLVEHK